MNKVYYDIHIHSTLSACGDDLQTPNNILNMAMLKGLNMISINDHNSLKHLPTFEKIISSYDFLFLYGCEVTVKEGFHVLTYFETLNKALQFDEFLDLNNKKIPHDEKRLGRQVICNEFDEELETVKYTLNHPLEADLNDIIKKVRDLDGIVIPAHINRGGSGILSVYQDLSMFDIDGIEIYGKENTKELQDKYSLSKYKVIYDSDAHSLEIINERINYLELEELSFKGFKKYLRG